MNSNYEWNRLESDYYHQLEYIVTWHYLNKYLPKTGKILDAGGGPGRYSLDLCRKGYDVTLLDISKENIILAKQKFALESPDVHNKLTDAVQGDIRDMSRFESHKFDATLCLGGPLSCIADKQQRLQALSEIVRVTKKDGVIILGVMGYYAMLRTVMKQASDQLLDEERISLIQKGENIVRGERWHFFTVERLIAEVESCGLKTIDIAGCEGLSSGLQEATNALNDPIKRNAWEKIITQTSADRAIAEISEHMIFIGEKQ